ncbi:MAG: beta-glycosidase, partial [Bacteroidales bacterium]|nr:beta-glycosidase [Bacteroidales bacterium]
MKRAIFILIATTALLWGCNCDEPEWISTTVDSPWQAQDPAGISQGILSDAVILIDIDATAQTIEGFGSCASELSWASLSVLPKTEREAIFRELFAPGVGANFTMERTPIGASDFSLDYYSYDSVDGDFALGNFSVARDRDGLLPFLKAALAQNPDLKIWASPWCPPSWMKVNRHYANRSTPPYLPTNGLAADKQIPEGQDAFILEPEYLDAYARYFGKYIDAYRAEGVNVSMVMPQNEPNSDQWFPACTWTPEGLAKFISVLGPEMEKRGVNIFLGTMERGDVSMWERILKDPAAGPFIKGMGFQWAGRDALPALHAEYPDLPCYMTEQECGNGANDWAGVLHSWELMKHYLSNGCQGYFYWNTSLFEGEPSTWGWRQNSLVTVNRSDSSWRFTPEYYLLKHLSHFVMPGAKLLRTSGPVDEDVLAFLNPDGKVVVLVVNPIEEAISVAVDFGKN